MKKRIFRLTCCLAACSALAFTGCGDIMDSLMNKTDASDRSYASDEWNPSEDATVSSSSSSSERNDSETESGQESSGNIGGETSGQTPSPSEPDPEKVLLYTETDDIGHKIAYYTDETKEDLGRVTAIDFSVPEPAQQSGYRYLSALEDGEDLCAFYEELYTVARNFHYSEKNVTATDSDGEKLYEISEFRFSSHGLNKDEAAGVWRTVALDYPQFFWWGNSLLIGENTMTLLADSAYATASARSAAQTAIEKMVNDCDGYLDGTTTLVERALTVHDFVTKITAYAYMSDGVTPETAIWAHNIAGAAQYGKGVCESYAKTYDYLCGTFNLPCITVTGDALQDGQTIGHAWNAVQIDGAWYNVDATWNDVDDTTLSRQWFGTSPAEFNLTHAAGAADFANSVNYMIELPAMDEQGLTPVRAAREADIRNGVWTANDAPMYATIEDVSAVTVADIPYEAYIYPRTAATPEKAKIVLQGATVTDIHTAGTLAINGEYLAYGEGYYNLAELSAPDGLTLSGDVIFRNIQFTAPDLDLGGKTLTAEGTAVELTTTNPIRNGNFTDKTTGWADVSAISLQTVTAQGAELRLLDGGTVERANIESGVLRLYGGANVTIQNLWIKSEKEQLYIDNATNQTQITVGDVTSGVEENSETGTAASIPEYVTVFVAFTSAATYPKISVQNKTASSKLYLAMYSDYVRPNALGRAFLNVGEGITVSSLLIGYKLGGMMQQLSSYLYEKTESGDICYKL